LQEKQPTQNAQTDAEDGHKLLRIGQLAELCNKTARALHLYEELGLLRPVIRSRGGFRLYSHAAVERVQWISRLQEADVSLGEISQLLRDLEGQRIGTEAMTKLRSLFSQKLTETREQIEKLTRLEQDLRAGLDYLDGCKVCDTGTPKSECERCRIHGHNGPQPLLVAGIRGT
jgi:DNA-binding transcriptional MerR regulator